jgi:hypothetical protein
MRLTTDAFDELSAFVGEDLAGGVARVDQGWLGLSHDDDPERWNVALEMWAPTPWLIRHRAELFGELLEVIAAEVDASGHPIGESPIVVLSLEAGLEGVLRTVDGYANVRELNDDPGNLLHYGVHPTVTEALGNAIAESFFGP